MRLPLGTRMTRESDGRDGQVSTHDGEIRITYTDRGETFVAPRAEKWVETELKTLPLREEEIQAVALTADRMLEAFVKHTPFRWYEPIDLDRAAFDAKLVSVIVEHLGTRGK